MGFIFVLFGRSELFTEHTVLAILLVLRGNVKIRDLFILWGNLYGRNIIGGIIFSMIIVKIESAIGIISEEAFYDLAYKMINYEFWIILFTVLLDG